MVLIDTQKGNAKRSGEICFQRVVLALTSVVQGGDQILDGFHPADQIGQDLLDSRSASVSKTVPFACPLEIKWVTFTNPEKNKFKTQKIMFRFYSELHLEVPCLGCRIWKDVKKWVGAVSFDIWGKWRGPNAGLHEFWLWMQWFSFTLFCPHNVIGLIVRIHVLRFCINCTNGSWWQEVAIHVWGEAGNLYRAQGSPLPWNIVLFVPFCIFVHCIFL